MDFYKLLTRATNLSKTRPKSDLPSAGQVANPQLFGRDDADSFKAGAILEKDEAQHSASLNSVSKKRKRPAHEEQGIPAEIDFFHTSTITPALPTRTASHSVKHVKSDETVDLESCKRILRSHKIKISSLSQKSRKVKSTKEKPKSSALYIQPLTAFSQLSSRYDLRKKLVRNIESEGYSVPTEVQLAALPILLGEKLLSDELGDREIQGVDDLLVAAPTGSGKTLAFLIPIINSLVARRGSDDHKDGPYALIVAPTRELAAQIVNEGRKLALKTGLNITLIKKGMRVGSDAEFDTDDHKIDQKDEDAPSSDDAEDSDDNEGTKNDSTSVQPTIVKSDIIVTTPMAVLNALRRGKGKSASLSTIEYLVLDEADVLLDPLFQEQTLSVWDTCTNPTLGTSLWSATMSSSIEELAVSKITSQKATKPRIVRLVIGLKDAALPTVLHKLVYAATETGKLLALRQLLRPTGPTAAIKENSVAESELKLPFLVFTQTIPRAVALHAELRYDIPPEAGGSSRIAVLHAGMSESTRSRVMSAFRRGEVWVIITTDILARGVDFRGLNGVVNYDVPTSAAAYVHRAGRTGRAGRKGGVVVTLYTQEDVPILKPIANVIDTSEKMTGAKESSVKWLLDSLPAPSKQQKKDLKKKGVEVRRPGFKGALISTKAPDERRKSNYKKSRRQPQEKSKVLTKGGDSEFEGFAD